ncbi:alpha/beta hydrolase-fold protein [Gilvimarinus sp. SDUM040013]|uniref:Alpha/beta hydrolase-fold protein n=1 Tax=Gilvimarinus gilvus TaxID=3058038 RepID=A0ABU4S135_9GAMM|nr:alpha/beta hydrolase-fold protein [Gilvimarinus sp. SDUM040013]MDO3384544.1 alpha/beta hydrolase-fold protein [Gilvimarinus sp. SDUM040013]MDX6850121.1 alpha/beta hydrolase-fold protein [Gilvimarinus sp. SDUM040013]
MNIKAIYLTVLLLGLPACVLATDYKAYQMPHTQVVPIRDPLTNADYELYVKLPKNYYDNKDKHYPVLYFTDAMWAIEALSSSTYYIFEDVILVGISWRKDITEKQKNEVGVHASRFPDYTFKKSDDPEIQAKYQPGKASRHLTFIRNNVIPRVEEIYRAENNNRTYFGYSTGGLFGFYILLTQPDTFNNYLLGSPSVWYYVPELSDMAINLKPAPGLPPRNVMISRGTEEIDLGKHIEKVVSALASREDNFINIHQHYPNGDHVTAFPETVIQSVKWLYQKQ